MSCVLILTNTVSRYTAGNEIVAVGYSKFDEYMFWVKVAGKDVLLRWVAFEICQGSDAFFAEKFDNPRISGQAGQE